MTIYWEDLKIGDRFSSQNNSTLSEEEIIEFASEFDPQPYHLDPNVAEASIFGGLCASGWQISALTLKMVSECFRTKKIALMGLASVERLRWKKPVFAGDILTVEVALIKKYPKSHLPNMGKITADISVKNQKNEIALTLTNSFLISLKDKNHEEE